MGELASCGDRVGRGRRGPGGARRCRGIRTSLATLLPGTQNYSGQSVFSVVPVEGVMEPGKAQDFTVTFSPDHESLYFSDRLQVVLFEKAGLRPSLDPSSPPACPLVKPFGCLSGPTLELGAWGGSTSGWGSSGGETNVWGPTGPHHSPAPSQSPTCRVANRCAPAPRKCPTTSS